ncbi:MAG: hypothetical protein Q7R97_04965 [Candidatus Daviesbacteria bacterium]|nr:hypothetical protein [Candidatus Daviesbacteria bacterium]
MKAKKHSTAKIQKKQKNSLTSIHGMGIGAVVMAIGWLIAASMVTIIGVLIFVPSAGMALAKHFKKIKKH